MIETIESDEVHPEEQLMTTRTEGREKARLADALKKLDPRERFIVEQRYMQDEEASLADIGRTLGVSRERARQLEARAKQKLREGLHDLAFDRVA